MSRCYQLFSGFLRHLLLRVLILFPSIRRYSRGYPLLPSLQIYRLSRPAKLARTLGQYADHVLSFRYTVVLLYSDDGMEGYSNKFAQLYCYWCGAQAFTVQYYISNEKIQRWLLPLLAGWHRIAFLRRRTVEWEGRELVI